jgi:hypothetical protein
MSTRTTWALKAKAGHTRAPCYGRAMGIRTITAACETSSGCTVPNALSGVFDDRCAPQSLDSIDVTFALRFRQNKGLDVTAQLSRTSWRGILGPLIPTLALLSGPMADSGCQIITHLHPSINGLCYTYQICR